MIRPSTLIALTSAMLIIVINTYYITTLELPTLNDQDLSEVSMFSISFVQVMTLTFLSMFCFVFPALAWAGLGLNGLLAIVLNIGWVLLGVYEIVRM